MDYENIQIAYNKKDINTIYKKEDILYLMIKAYLKFNCTPLECVCTTLDELVSSVGYSIKGGNRRNHASVRLVLQEMIDRNEISINNFDKMRVSDFMRIKIVDFKQLFYCDNNFVLLNLREFNQITQCKTSTTPVNLFLGYLLIKQHIYDTSDVTSPKVAYPSKKILMAKLHCSGTTVETIIRDLVSNQILYSTSNLYIKKDNSFIPTRNVYALEQNQLKMSKDVLKEFYHVDKIYTYAETNGQVNYLTS